MRPIPVLTIATAAATMAILAHYPVPGHGPGHIPALFSFAVSAFRTRLG